MRIFVNGAIVELPDRASVSDAVVVVRPAATGRGVAVAVNGEVVPKSVWSDTELSPDDKVEVLTAVAGG